MLDVLKRTDSGQFCVAGKEAKTRWDRGWSENLDSFIEQGHDLSKLMPKYIKQDSPLRFYQGYVMPSDTNFELSGYMIFQLRLSKAYFQEVETVYKFGCGSGFNLAALAKLHPEKKFSGLDWVVTSSGTANEFAKIYG